MATSHRTPTERVARILARQHRDNLIDHSSNSTLVYVQDDDYGWLPAQLVDVTYADDPDTGEEGNGEGEGEAVEASVVVRLPENWVRCTQLVRGERGEGSSVEELEVDLGSVHGDGVSRMSSAVSDAGSVASARTNMSSGRPGQSRTVSLASYPHSELPLQNVDRNGRLLGKSDMADLPFLHEAAILYNLKDRHGRGVPYTRVGDIVVAMNPFRWIDGLYAEEKQAFYSERLIWNAPDDKDGDEDDKDEEEEDDEEDEHAAVENGGAEAAASNSHEHRRSRRKPPRSPRGKDKEELVASSVDARTFKSDYDRLGYEPHVYETACLAYRGLAVDQSDQTILVSGESGAGKTETVKIVMGHLATVEATRPFAKFTTDGPSGNALGADETVKRVLRSNPLFEAFGNARTVRNDNSSRFGRFTRLQFDVESKRSARRARREVPTCHLAGSTVETYLLEKSRVVGHGAGERTYHVFYQLLDAPEDEKAEIWDGLKGTTLESFRYVGSTDCRGIEGTTDADGWIRTRDALALFGIEGDRLRELMRALCAVLQLGNLVFEPDPASDHGESSVITSTEELELLSDLLGEPADVIERATTERVVRARGEEIRSHLTAGDAGDGRDALAKEIYARVFDVLVRRINEYTDAERHYRHKSHGHHSHDTGPGGSAGGRDGGGGRPRSPPQHVRPSFGLIALLDIFGFERFDSNRFEQLCINYANERLQQKYVSDNFRAVQEEYESEGIEIFDFTAVDNSEVLNLLEGKMGLIVSLNEECVRPKGNDESFVYKIKMVHTDSPHLLRNNLDKPTEFGVRHYAGPVSYDAQAFVERNTDRLPRDLLECACRSSNGLIREEFTKIAEEAEKARNAPRKRSVQTVVTKFKSQLTSLMSSIESTRTRYIRCIKPNPLMEPGRTNHRTTLAQLVCAGLVTAIAISRESFPNKLKYDLMVERFRCLVPTGAARGRRQSGGGGGNDGSLRGEVERILRTLLLSAEGDARDAPYACGKTKVYFRAGALERLETIRLEYFSARAILIQSWVRRILCQRQYRAMKRSAVVIQAAARRSAERRTFLRMKRAALRMQCFVRCVEAWWELARRREYRAATLIQKRWRIVGPRREFLKRRRAARLIQRAARKRRNEKVRRAKLAETAKNSQMDSKLSELKQQVSDEASVRTSRTAATAGGLSAAVQAVDEKLLEEIEMMFDYLRKEIYTLRGKNSDLRSEIRKLDQEKRELVNHAQSVEAASELSKLRVSQLTKTNSALIAEVMGHKQEVSHLKKDLKKRDHHHEKELSGLRDEFDKIVGIREVEVKKLKKELKDMRHTHRMETDMLREEVERIQDEHLTEVMRLKNELRKTQDSHHDYLAKLMDVLETTHAARETETARINEELNSVRDEKDAEIDKLRKEIHRLKRSQQHAAEASGSKYDLEKKSARAIKLREELNRGTAARAQRSRRFRELSDELEQGIQFLQIGQQGGTDAASRSKFGRKAAKKGAAAAAASARMEEEAARLRETVRTMAELYRSEESSHSNVDAEALRAVDDVMAASRKGESAKLKDALRATRAENDSLRRQVSDQSCRACGYRSSSGKSSGRHSRESPGRHSGSTGGWS